MKRCKDCKWWKNGGCVMPGLIRKPCHLPDGQTFFWYIPKWWVPIRDFFWRPK